MRSKLIRLIALGLLASVGGCSDEDTGAAAPEVVVDLDPASAGETVIGESITADEDGMLFLGDRVSGDILRVDPGSKTSAVVARIAARMNDMGMAVAADAGGLVFDARGDLLIASAPFNEVLRVPAAGLDARTPALATTFATGVNGANSLAFDGAGNLYVSGGRTGRIYRVGAAGGAAEVVAQIEPFTRIVPPSNVEQTVVANGITFDRDGDLFVADTARGAVWKVALGAAGQLGEPEILAESPLLYGVDGISFTDAGTLWAAVNERNALVTISSDGQAADKFKNDSAGPLEFPAAVVFVGDAGYVINYDRPRGDNLAADGMTSVEGVGASIVRVGLP